MGMEVVAWAVGRALARKNVCHAVETGTIRSYTEKHESTRIFAETIGAAGSVMSIDNDPRSIEIASDICKAYDNVSWVLDDSVAALGRLVDEGRVFDVVLLDSVNDPRHILREFRHALRLVEDDGVILIDDFGVSPVGRSPDPSQPDARKGLDVYKLFIRAGQLSALRLYQSRKGTQAIIVMTPGLRDRLRGTA